MTGPQDDREPHLPFRPWPREAPVVFPMPPSVPAGLRLELSRARIRPGEEQHLEEWMRMLNDRYDELLPALPAERAVVEATFRSDEADGSTWIYHLALMGEDGGGLDETVPIAAEHAACSRRVKEPGWEELRPMLLLTPDALRTLMERLGRTGQA